MRFLLLFSVTGCLFLLTASLSGDTLLLRSGRRIEGRIISQSRGMIRIRTAQGIRNIPKNRVRRLKYGPFDPQAAQKKAERERQERIRREALEKKQEAERKRRQEAELRRAQEAAEKKERSEREKRAAGAKTETQASFDPAGFWRSLVLPGWGQFYQGRGTAGRFYAGAVLAGLAGAGWTEINSARLATVRDQRQRLLDLVVLSNEEARGEALDLVLTLRRDASARQANQSTLVQRQMLMFAGAIYLANLIDVTVYTPLRNDVSLRLGLAPGAAAVAFEVRF